MFTSRRQRLAVSHILPVSLALTTFISQCAAHMKMRYPLPLGDPALGGADPDYDLTSPLAPDGSDYPCKGYSSAPWDQQASWTAGQSYNMTVAGSAPHGGGSCQLSLSYDRETFRVIKSMIGGCPLTTTYDFTIPSYAPGGQALFAWTWQNEVGNREFYMNCAQVEIEGALSSNSVRRADALGGLPQIWVANIASENSCTTTAGVDPVYPAPGCDVEYGGEYNATTPPGPTSNPGECDFGSSQPTCSGSSAVPGVFAESASDSENTSDTSVSPANVANPGMVMAEVPSSSASQSLLLLSTVTDFGSPPSSTPTIGDDDPNLIAPLFGGPLAEEQSPDGGPVFLGPQLGGPLAIQGPEGSSNDSSDDSLDDCADVTLMVTGSSTSTVTTMTASPTTTSPYSCDSGVITVTATAPAVTTTWYPSPTRRPYPPPQSVRPTSSPPLQSPTSTSFPSSPGTPPNSGAEYAGANIMAYMPCEPGYFLCSDASTFYTCDQTTDPSQRWVWQYPRQVAAGMMCQPQLVACANGLEGCSTGSGNIPAGYTREDQYVRAN